MPEEIATFIFVHELPTTSEQMASLLGEANFDFEDWNHAIIRKNKRNVFLIDRVNGNGIQAIQEFREENPTFSLRFRLPPYALLPPTIDFRTEIMGAHKDVIVRLIRNIKAVNGYHLVLTLDPLTLRRDLLELKRILSGVKIEDLPFMPSSSPTTPDLPSFLRQPRGKKQAVKRSISSVFITDYLDEETLPPIVGLHIFDSFPNVPPCEMKTLIYTIAGLSVDSDNKNVSVVFYGSAETEGNKFNQEWTFSVMNELEISESQWHSALELVDNKSGEEDQ